MGDAGREAGGHDRCPGPCLHFLGAGLIVSHHVKVSFGVLVGCTTACLLVLLLVAHAAGFAEADLSTGDEAAHFVNGLLIHDYLRQGAPTGPMTFAKDYYLHFPRVSIGHWPPFFYLIEAAWMFGAGRSEAAAQFLQLLVTALLAGTTAAVVARRAGLLLGTAAAFLVIANPGVLHQAGTVMLDNALALMLLLSGLAWARYAQTRDWRWSVAFGAAALASIMTKGNALGLAFLPPFYCLLSGDWRVLRLARTWIAALIVLPPTILWLVLTLGIVEDGFKYKVGMAFTAMAVRAYLAAAPEIVGPAAVLGFLCGVVGLVRRSRRGEPDAVGCSMAALVLAVFCFTVIAPAEITGRYLIAVVPPVILVALDGLSALALAALPGASPLRNAPLLRNTTVLAAMVLSAGWIAEWPHPQTRRTNLAAGWIAAAPPNGPLVLAAGTAETEGGVTAAFASFGDARTFVLRASKAMAASNFMGSDYKSRFDSAEQAGAWMEQNHIGWVVLERTPASMDFEHDRLIDEALRTPGAGWHQAARFPIVDGDMLVYRRTVTPPTPAEIAETTAQVAATKLLGSR